MSKTPVSLMQEYCAKSRLEPIYKFETSPTGFYCYLQYSNILVKGEGQSKRIAKHDAASKALDIVTKERVEQIVSIMEKMKRSEMNTVISSVNDATLIDTTTDKDDNQDLKTLIQFLNESYNHNEIQNYTYNAEVEPKHSDKRLAFSIESGIENPSSNIAALSNHCMKNFLPLPRMQIVYKEDNKVIVECSVASLKKRSDSDIIDVAKEDAAAKMLDFLIHVLANDELHGKNRKNKIEKRDYSECFKIHRKLCETDRKFDNIGLPLERQWQYFHFYPENIKTEARKVIATKYTDYEKQAMDILRILNLKSSKFMWSNMEKKCQYFIELDSEFDATFAGPEPRIYKNIVDFFNIML